MNPEDTDNIDYEFTNLSQEEIDELFGYNEKEINREL